MKKVSVVDTATQTDPVTIVDPAVQSKTTSSNNKTEELQKQKLRSNTTKKSQTKTSIEEKQTEAGLKNATMEMIRKDWKKQQQKERQARSQSSPTKDQTKSKSTQDHKDQSEQTENKKVLMMRFNNIIDSDL